MDSARESPRASRSYVYTYRRRRRWHPRTNCSPEQQVPRNAARADTGLLLARDWEVADARQVELLLGIGSYANLFLDLHKVYIDDEHYNSGHGHAYEKYGIDPEVGAVVIVRPDQCKSAHPEK